MISVASALVFVMAEAIVLLVAKQHFRMGETPAYLVHALTYTLTTDDGPWVRLHSGHGYGFNPQEREWFNQTAEFMWVAAADQDDTDSVDDRPVQGGAPAQGHVLCQPGGQEEAPGGGRCQDLPRR